MNDGVMVFIADEHGRWLGKLRLPYAPREGERIAFSRAGAERERTYHVASVIWTFDEPTAQGETALLHVKVVVRSLDEPSPYR